jgi:hypothetical protein
MLIHRDTAKLLSDADWSAREITTFPSVLAHAINYGDLARNCSDIRMALVVHLGGGARNKYAVSVPSVFKHVGIESLCFPGRSPSLGERETRNYVA